MTHCQLVVAVDWVSLFAMVDLYRGSDPMTGISAKLALIVPYPMRSGTRAPQTQTTLPHLGGCSATRLGATF